jgi:hypothetical protein
MSNPDFITIDNPGGGNCGFFAFAIGLIPHLQRELQEKAKNPALPTPRLDRLLQYVGQPFDRNAFERKVLRFRTNEWRQNANKELLNIFNTILRNLLAARYREELNKIKEVFDAHKMLPIQKKPNAAATQPPEDKDSGIFKDNFSGIPLSQVITAFLKNEIPSDLIFKSAPQLRVATNINDMKKKRQSPDYYLEYNVLLHKVAAENPLISDAILLFNYYRGDSSASFKTISDTEVYQDPVMHKKVRNLASKWQEKQDARSINSLRQLTDVIKQKEAEAQTGSSVPATTEKASYKDHVLTVEDLQTMGIQESEVQALSGAIEKLDSELKDASTTYTPDLLNALRKAAIATDPNLRKNAFIALEKINISPRVIKQLEQSIAAVPTAIFIFAKAAAAITVFENALLKIAIAADSPSTDRDAKIEEVTNRQKFFHSVDAALSEADGDLGKIATDSEKCALLKAKINALQQQKRQVFASVAATLTMPLNEAEKERQNAVKDYESSIGYFISEMLYSNDGTLSPVEQYIARKQEPGYWATEKDLVTLAGKLDVHLQMYSNGTTVTHTEAKLPVVSVNNLGSFHWVTYMPFFPYETKDISPAMRAMAKKYARNAVLTIDEIRAVLINYLQGGVLYRFRKHLPSFFKPQPIPHEESAKELFRLCTPNTEIEVVLRSFTEKVRAEVMPANLWKDNFAVIYSYLFHRYGGTALPEYQETMSPTDPLSLQKYH